MIRINDLKPGDHFFLENIEYRKIRMKRSATHGRVNAQNVATYEKRYVMETVEIEPVTDSYLYRITPRDCVFVPNHS